MKPRKRYTPPPDGNFARHLVGGPKQGVVPSRKVPPTAPTTPTAPPPPEERGRSGVRARRSQRPPVAATVDEVTADLSKDPRRED
jgi:hypothetical protein